MQKANFCIDCNKNIWKPYLRCKNCANKGSNNPNYNNFKKDITYSGLHTWIHRTLGKASHCSFNLEHQGKYEWANISGAYLRAIDDWSCLCIKCHRQYDWIKRGKLLSGKWLEKMNNNNRDSKTGRFI